MKNRSQTLREAIEEQIAVGKLKPGDHLDETELAKEFGVSRTPIREALIQLASTGIVMMRRRRGAVVAAANPQQIMKMFEVMAENEAKTGRQTAHRKTAAKQTQLLAAHEACRGAAEAND